MKKTLLLLLLLTICICGCGKIELYNASIPLAMGLDLQDNKLVFVTQVADLENSTDNTDGTASFKLITSSGRSVSEAARNINQYSAQIPLWSQIQVSVLGENLCKQTITQSVDFLVRNRFVRTNDLIVVSYQASPEQILSVKPYFEPYTAIAIRNLLYNQEKLLGIYTPINAHEFLQALITPGIEPIAPMITLRKKGGSDEQLLLDGMAVFKKGKMIGRLNEEESRGFSFMRYKPYQSCCSLILVPWDQGEQQWLTLEISQFKTKITPQVQQQQINMNIQLIAEGNFYEQGGQGNLFTRETFKQIEKACEHELGKQMSMCIQKSQTLNSDILGWGQTLSRVEPEFWETAGPQWDTVFPAITYDLDVRFSLRRSYETDKSLVYR